MSFGRQLPRQILEEIMLVPGYVFAVLDAEPLGRQAQSPPLDGAELSA